MPERLLDLECADAGPLAGDGAQPVVRAANSISLALTTGGKPRTEARVLGSRFGQLVLHVENGLLEIFLSVCGSSTPAWSSCQDERRQQTDRELCLLLLLCSSGARAAPSCTTARLHSNPGIASLNPNPEGCCIGCIVYSDVVDQTLIPLDHIPRGIVV